MVTGKDMLVDKMVAWLYQLAGEGYTQAFTKRHMMDALDCANSPTFRLALDWTIQTGLLIADYGYVGGRYVRIFTLTSAAVEAARADQGAEHANQIPF